jgi:cbb3-type cytochrome c oxidase subunit III
VNNKAFLQNLFLVKLPRNISGFCGLMLLAFGLSTNAAWAEDQVIGDADAGKSKAATCAACHGMDGNSVNPQWPSIAGQHTSYLTSTLNAFKSGTREDVLMGSQAALLSDQDIADLAAYFSSQTATKRTASPELAETGERIYRGGDKETSVSACIACHGPTGRGNAPAGYPSLTSQHAVYTAKQLSDYKNGNRVSDGDTQMMRSTTAQLSQTQIDAVAAYIQGLR